jgi:hypothetical protein
MERDIKNRRVLKDPDKHGKVEAAGGKSKFEQSQIVKSRMGLRLRDVGKRSKEVY